jgi:succinylglutamate desuccinylase
MWTDKIIQSKSNQKTSEFKEVLMVKELIDKIIKLKKKRNITIIDLHNTSSPNGVFSIVNNLREKKIAEHLQIPVINNLFKKVKGSLAEYYSSKQINSIVFEGGAIGDPAAINNHEAGIWKMLAIKGFISEDCIPERVLKNNINMRNFSKETKGYYFVKYIHKIKKENEFLMNPNMRNFEKIKKGQVVGHDNNGPVNSPHAGYLLMPLYQKQGKEGFYLINKFKA